MCIFMYGLLCTGNTCFGTYRLDFGPMAVLVIFIGGKVVLGNVSSEYFRFIVSVFFHKHSILIFISLIIS